MPRHPGSSPSAQSLSDTVYGALVAKARARGGTVHPLNVGDTYLEPLESARAEAQRTSDHPRLHNYAPVQGEPVLLDAIVRFLRGRSGREVARDDVQVMCGATAGISVVVASILSPGDELLLLAPYWPLVRGIVASRGAVPVEIPFHDRVGQPGFDVEAELEQRIGPRTSAIYVNTPNNPTGRALSEEALAAIARVAARHDLWVLADEAYELLDYRAAPTPPVWARPELAGRTIATHTLSKSFGLAGARVGFTHGPHDVMATIRGVQTFQTYCAPRPMQLGAARALDDGAEWLAAAKRAYAEAARRSADVLGLPMPDGGTFLFFDASRWLAPGEELVAFLERCLDAGVLLTPGAASGKDYARWARLCFTAVPPEALDDALARLRRVLG